MNHQKKTKTMNHRFFFLSRLRLRLRLPRELERLTQHKFIRNIQNIVFEDAKDEEMIQEHIYLRFFLSFSSLGEYFLASASCACGGRRRTKISIFWHI